MKHDKQLTDEEIIELHWNRNEEALTATDDKYGKYLYAIAYNIIHDNRKTADKRIPSELSSSLEELDGCLPDGEEVEDEILRREVINTMNAYLHELDKREVLIFICRYYYSDSIDSIASMLNVSRNTVFRDLAKIREGLKERLIEEGYYHE